MKLFLNRLTYKFYNFYKNLDHDSDDSFYFSAFAISFIAVFYLIFFVGLINFYLNITLVPINGFTLSILAIVLIAVLVVIFYKKKSIILKNIQLSQPKFQKMDIAVWLFTICGFISAFVGVIIL